MLKVNLLLFILCPFISFNQTEKQLRKLKITSYTITRKFPLDSSNVTLENKKNSNSSEVIYINCNNRGRLIQKKHETKTLEKLNGVDTFLVSTSVSKFNRKGKKISEEYSSERIFHFSKDSNSTYNYSYKINYKYNLFNRLLEETFINNQEKSSSRKWKKTFSYSLFGKLKSEMMFGENEKLKWVDEYFYRNGKLVKQIRWHLNNNIYVNLHDSISQPIESKNFLNNRFTISSTTTYSYNFDNQILQITTSSTNDKNHIFYIYEKNYRTTVYQNKDFKTYRKEILKLDEQKRIISTSKEGQNAYYYYTSDGLLERINFYNFDPGTITDSPLPTYCHEYQYFKR